MLIAGISCYSRALDYARFKKIADANGSLLMADMAHVAGLVATKLAPSPFEHCDIVTSTVHKTMRGPRAGIIFFRRGVKCIDKAGNKVMYDFEDRINQAVFPGLQGGPHNHAVGGVAIAMKHATTQEFNLYQHQVVSNSRRLSDALIKLGYRIVTGGTDTHLVLLDLTDKKLSGAKAERILEDVSISVNKNTVPGDKSALNPSGIRFGLPPLTTRGFKNDDIDVTVDFIHRAFQLALEIQAESGPKLVDWKKALVEDKFASKVTDLKKEVEEYAVKFPLPGLDEI